MFRLTKRRTLTILMGSIVLMTFITAQLYLSALSDYVESGQAGKPSSPRSVDQLKIERLTKEFKVNWTCALNDKMAAWQLAESWVSPRQITPRNGSAQLGCVLRALHASKIVRADVGSKGTQLKLTLMLDGGQRVVFKPKFYDADYVMVGTPYAGKDRHYAEIAAFHVSRILGLNKVPLAVGRTVCLDTEIRPVAAKALLDTYYHRSGSTCFYGKCLYCKGPETGVCANGTLIEGSVTMWLPAAYRLGNLKRHPWARTYNPNRSAKWQSDPDYCRPVLKTPPYDRPPRLLDLIDIAVFDYVISNADRHHYETFENIKGSMVAALDNGKSFGNPYVDEPTILAPLNHCCIIREATYRRITELRDGVLSRVLYNVLLDEPISPVLTRSHYRALDRRLETVIRTVDRCIADRGNRSRVLVNDGFY